MLQLEFFKNIVDKKLSDSPTKAHTVLTIYKNAKI